MSNTSVVLVHVSPWILKLILVSGPTLEGKFGLTAPVSRFLYGPVFSTVVAYHRLYRVSIPRPQTLICTADVIRLSLYPCVLWLFSSAWNLKSHRPVLQYLCSRLGLLVISDVVLFGLVRTVFPPFWSSATLTRRSTHVLSFPCFFFPGQPVQHGAFLRDAQLVRLLARQADLLQRLQRSSARRHLPRPVLWRYNTSHDHVLRAVIFKLDPGNRYYHCRRAFRSRDCVKK